jgi:hypothetical protein
VAARLVYEPPHRQLLRLAADARREGLSFDAFWARAIPNVRVITWKTPPEERPPGCVLWPADSFDRQCARAVYEDPVVEEEWRRCWDGETSRNGAALLMLASWLEAIPTRPLERTGAARVLA